MLWWVGDKVKPLMKIFTKKKELTIAWIKICLDYMKIALSILKKYIPVQLTAEEVADAFVHLGFEIEGTETLGYCGKGPLVVGQVLEKVKHPNSDHLSVCKVNVGQTEPLQIVCGASNFKEGDKVPVALVGAQLGDMTMKKTNMRGFDSCGMMCSASELGLEAGHSAGLFILNDINPEVGTPLDDLFADKKEVILDVSITSNRGDCLSYLGLARDLSALTGIPLTLPKLADISLPADPTTVEVESADCDYYSGCLIENVRIQESPQYIQDFLQKSGLHPINNLVDVTNFVLLEQGQPLHAFDADKICGKLHVRNANDGETLKTLDGVKRKLKAGDLIIADDQAPQALAGVMGGESSEIKDTTQRIFIECAHFSVDAIRRLVHRENITSDSSYRFERFVDKTNAQNALCRAVELLRETNPNLVIKKFVKIGSEAIEPTVLRVDFQKIIRVLGFEISAEDFKGTLEKLQFKFETLESNVWNVTVPAYRGDVTQCVDLIEEFVRVWGADKIPTKIPDGIACDIADAPEHVLRMRHASILSNAGFYECYTDTLQPVDWCKEFLTDNQLSVLTLDKPLSAEHALLRTSLVPGLVESLCRNRHHGNSVERLFETGRIFKVNRNGELCEMLATAFVFCPSEEGQWLKTTPFNFYEAQNYVRSLIMASGMPATSIQTASATEIPLWQKDYCGKIGLWEQRGFEADLGYLDLNFTQRWFKNDIVFAAECMWLPERIRVNDKKVFHPYSEYPVITKDLALWVNKDVLGEEVRQSLIKTLKKLVKNPVQVREVRLFDLFNDKENLSKKSLAFSIVFGSNCDTTLTEEMVSPIFESLQTNLEKNFDYQIRK